MNDKTQTHLETGVGLDHRGVEFPPTHWSVLLVPSSGAEDAHYAGFSKLCGQYWYPIYAFLRKDGFNSVDAQDRTQAFFAHILEDHRLKRLDPEKGRFRSYLLGSLRHFLSNERRRAQAAKRGGGVVPLSFEQDIAEERFRALASLERSPDEIFDRKGI